VAQSGFRSEHSRGLWLNKAQRTNVVGRRMEVQLCDVYRLENVKILRAGSYFDFSGLLRQLAPALASQ
jgi:hypothetical protein